MLKNNLILFIFLSFNLLSFNAQDINFYWNNANTHFNNKEYHKTIKYCDSILSFESQIPDNTKAQVLILQAQSFSAISKYENAKKSIDKAKELNIKKDKTNLFLALTEGDINLSLRKYKSAISSYENALTLSTGNKDKLEINNDIAYAYSKLKDYKEAINYTNKSIELAQLIGDKKSTITNEIELSKLYSNYGNYSASINTLSLAKEHSENLGNYKKNQIEKIDLLINENKSNSESAATGFDAEQDIATLELIEDITISKAKSIAEIEKLSVKMQLTEYRIKAQADEYQKKILIEKLKRIEKEKELEISEATNTITKAKLRAKEAKLKEEKALSEKRKLLIYGTSIVIVLSTFAILALFFLIRVKQKSNKALKTKNVLIEKQKTDIKNKADQIHDSIQYARKIQQAILPSSHSFKKTFSNSFVYLNPKEKVSGDFFWFFQNNSYKYAAAIDCTGHGVPGAFMTIICHQIINDIINRNKNIKPSEILTQASERLSNVFKQSSEELGIKVKDGMDLSLVRIDTFNKVLLHAGARNPLYIIREGKLIELKGSRKSISANNSALAQINFEDNEFTFSKNDTLYLFSDGFVDQKGEKSQKKYYYKNFRNKLISISEFPLSNQRDLLNKEFISWKGGYEQLDDVLIIGIDPLS